MYVAEFSFIIRQASTTGNQMTNAAGYTAVENGVLSVIADAAGKSVSSVSLNHDLYDDLNLDSLDVAALFVRLDEEFRVPEPKTNEDFYKLRDVNSVVKYVWNHVSRRDS
jgi:acyl carrier protein